MISWIIVTVITITYGRIYNQNSAQLSYHNQLNTLRELEHDLNHIYEEYGDNEEEEMPIAIAPLMAAGLGLMVDTAIDTGKQMVEDVAVAKTIGKYSRNVVQNIALEQNLNPDQILELQDFTQDVLVDGLVGAVNMMAGRRGVTDVALDVWTAMRNDNLKQEMIDNKEKFGQLLGLSQTAVKKRFDDPEIRKQWVNGLERKVKSPYTNAYEKYNPKMVAQELINTYTQDNQEFDDNFQGLIQKLRSKSKSIGDVVREQAVKNVNRETLAKYRSNLHRKVEEMANEFVSDVKVSSGVFSDAYKEFHDPLYDPNQPPQWNAKQPYNNMLLYNHMLRKTNRNKKTYYAY